MREDNIICENVKYYENKKSTLEKEDIKRNHRNYIGKSSDTRNYTQDGLLEHIPQDGLLISLFLSSLREVRFSEQELTASKPMSNIKYHYRNF